MWDLEKLQGFYHRGSIFEVSLTEGVSDEREWDLEKLRGSDGVGGNVGENFEISLLGEGL
jgi:hypothetical protein